MTHALIIDACRTPRRIGKPGKGSLTEIHRSLLTMVGASWTPAPLLVELAARHATFGWLDR